MCPLPATLSRARAHRRGFAGFFWNDNASGRGVFAKAGRQRGAGHHAWRQRQSARGGIIVSDPGYTELPQPPLQRGIVMRCSTRTTTGPPAPSSRQLAVRLRVFNANENGQLCTSDGTLSKGGGSFKIDHPLDPENKYLYHSFVESPDMMNVYNGNVVLDERRRGRRSSCRSGSRRSTATSATSSRCIGGGSRGSCTIAAGDRRQPLHDRRRAGRASKVSWQVTGIRQDAFAERQPHPGRGGQARGRARALPPPRGVRPAGGAGGRHAARRPPFP